MKTKVIQFRPDQKLNISSLRSECQKAHDLVRISRDNIQNEIARIATIDGGIQKKDIKSQTLSDCGNYIVVQVYSEGENRKQGAKDNA